MFCSPTFPWVDIFRTNAHGIHWISGTIFVKFVQLILVKIIKIVATRCQILRLKCAKFNFGWGSVPDPAEGAYSSPPDSLAEFKFPTSKGRGGEERGKGSPLLFSVDLSPWLTTQ